MALPSVTISGHGMDVTDAVERYITEKLQKHEALFSIATGITIECTQQKASRGVEADFRVEISLSFPKTMIRVEKSGADIYAVFDEVIDVLLRKVKRYKDKHHQWDGKKPLKVEYMDQMRGNGDEEEVQSYTDYVPKIVERIELDNCTPMSEAEAIEHMELTDQPCFLFKKVETGVFAVVYKRKRGGYGIIEPCS